MKGGGGGASSEEGAQPICEYFHFNCATAPRIEPPRHSTPMPLPSMASCPCPFLMPSLLRALTHNKHTHIHCEDWDPEDPDPGPEPEHRRQLGALSGSSRVTRSGQGQPVNNRGRVEGIRISDLIPMQAGRYTKRHLAG